MFYISGIVATVFKHNPAFLWQGILRIDSMIPLMATLLRELFRLFQVYVIKLMRWLFHSWWMVTSSWRISAVGDVNGTASPKSFIKTARLQNPGFQKTQVHTGLIIMIIASYLYLCSSLWDKVRYAIRMTGINPPLWSTLAWVRLVYSLLFISLLVHLVAGFIRWTLHVPSIYLTVLPGLGFTGALMAMLGKMIQLVADCGVYCVLAQLLATTYSYIDIKMILL